MSEPKKCHYISQVYLRKWGKSNNINKVNVYDKTKKQVSENSFKIDNKFYINNLYNITFSDTLTYLNQFPLMKNDFQEKIKNFQEGKNIKIYYKNKLFNINNDNLGYLMDKENVDFLKDSQFVFKKEKNNLYNELSHLKSTLIEKEFCNAIEDKWNQLIQTIATSPRLNGKSLFIHLNDNDMETLRNMTVTMALRIKDTPGFPNLSKQVQEISDFAKIFFTDMFNIKKAGEAMKDFPELFFKKSNYSALFEIENSHLRNALFEKNVLNYELYVINETDNFDFHTSDVPCFQHIGNYEVDNRNNAIYFPISPKMLVTLKRDNELSNNINIFEVNEEQVRYFNNLIYNHATRYVIYKNSWEDK